MSERFRHEDIASVPAGWKVRTVTTSGGHRVRVAFPPGRRVKGAGRLVSILHPLSGSNPCGNPCSLRSTNPQELMVMSANNPPRGRRNSFGYRVIAVPRWGGANLTRDFETREEAKEFARKEINTKDTYFKPHIQKVRKSGTNPHELLIMGANPRVEVVHGENPPVEDIHEEFTGQEVKWIDVYNEPHMPAGRYAELGPLIALYVKPVKGGQVQRIGAPEAVEHGFPEYWNGKPPLIVTDSTAKQIYFVDGCQDLTNLLDTFVGGQTDNADLYELGEVRRIDYQCLKEHVAHPDEDLWKHNHGEEDGKLPTLLFDARHKRMRYEGGNYRIEGPWIRN